MENRHTTPFAVSFTDIDSLEEKHQFTQALLNENTFTRHALLQDQYSAQPSSIEALREFILAQAALTSHANYNMLLEEIKTVLSSNLLVEGDHEPETYPGSCDQFILALLTQGANNRDMLLKTMYRKDPTALEQLLIKLTTSPQENSLSFDTSPNYRFLIDAILNIQEQHLNTKIPDAEEGPVLSISSSEKILIQTLPKEMSIFFEKFFQDPITYYDDIQEACITPAGITYDYAPILQWLQEHDSDPITRGKISSHDLLPNYLFREIGALFTQSSLKTEEFYQLLTCPLSGELFKNPVVAEDGHTYERYYIEAYLKESNDITPKGVVQHKPLYPHIAITNLLQNSDVLNIIRPHQLTAQQFSDTIKNEYLTVQRRHIASCLDNQTFLGAQENRYSLREKLTALTNLKRVLSGHMPVQTFFETSGFDKLLDLFICPLSNHVFEDPVTDKQGHTYERVYIEAYYDEHFNKTRPPLLMPNNFILEQLKKPYIQECVIACYASLNTTPDRAEIIAPLEQYRTIRMREERFAGWSKKYSKWDKLSAEAALRQTIYGKMSAHTFFSTRSDELKALQQRRLGKAAKPALAYLKQL